MGRRLLVFVLSLLLTALPLAAAGGCGDAPSGKAGMVAMDDAAGGCCDTAPGDDGGCGAGLCVSHGMATALATTADLPATAPAPAGWSARAPASSPRRRIDRPPIHAV